MVSIVFALAILFIGSVAFAQSSGNFSARVNTTKCLIDDTDGSLSTGIGATMLTTTIKTPDSKWTALVIRPSLVSGLFTKTRVTDEVSTSTASAGLQVRVLLDNKVVAPGTPVGCDVTIKQELCPGTQIKGIDAGWVYYDKRWQQINQNFLSIIKQLSDTAGITPAGGLYLELILSTLSAHSLDYVVEDVGGGTHDLVVEWKFEDSDATGSNAAACVGPAVVTVEQVKTFSSGGGIEITP